MASANARHLDYRHLQTQWWDCAKRRFVFEREFYVKKKNFNFGSFGINFVRIPNDYEHDIQASPHHLQNYCTTLANAWAQRMSISET